MNYKFCIIIPYFGKFPDTFDTFINSCRFNPEFDWLFFTDCTYTDLPANVKFVPCTLAELKKLIEEKLGFNVTLETSYKICDYRPAFGLIFQDYIKEYDFWGYGDIDLVYGNISTFITDELCKKYDKLLPCGHLSFVKNKEEINRTFLKEIKGTLSYKEVFSDNKPFIFDEYRGINEKLLHIKKKVYGKIVFADIDLTYKRFRMSDKNTISIVFPKYYFKKKLPTNHKYQLFYYKNGRTFVSYIEKNNTIKTKELLYIHYRRKISCNISKSEYYAITKCLNLYPGFKVEFLELFIAFKNNMILHLGKSKNIRNIVRFIKGKPTI